MAGHGLTRERNGNWQGGRTIASNGYVLVRVGIEHPLADVRGYAYEHRVVAERMLGRALAPGEVVHHRDGDKTNNAEANLEVLDEAHHRFKHRGADRGLRHPDKPNPEIECACGCGARLTRFDAHNRPRAFLLGHNPSKSSTIDAIVRALRSGPLHRRELCRRSGSTMRAVAVCLSKLKRRGVVAQLGAGHWALEESHG